MIRIAIVEDDIQFQNLLTDYLQRFENNQKIHFDISLFEDGMDLTESYKPIWDLIFMDINLKIQDGMTSAQLIREQDPKVVIFFITTLARFAIKGYEVNAFDFVLKPLAYDIFEVKLKKALAEIEKISRHKYLALSSGRKIELISTDEIFYIEVINHQLYFYKKLGYLTKQETLTKLEEDLVDFHFARCHNSYMINLKHLKTVDNDKVIIGEYTIPISRPRKKRFMQAVSDYLAGRTS